MKLIERKLYLQKLMGAAGTPDIKVITGVRRSGKSKLLDAFSEFVKKEYSDCNIISVNFNLPEYEDLLQYRALYEYVNSKHIQGVRNFVFIDEIQMCEGFEKAVNGLHASEKYDIYITGSNAFLLSSDLATLFTGRTFEIKVFPFSFAEFVQYFECEDKYSGFDRYLKEGGMAGSYLYTENEAKYDYIAEVFNTLIVRDIRTKYRIRNNQLMDKLVEFLMDNISNLSSARSITDILAGQKEKVSHLTISTYLQYLCNAFAFYKVRRYDIKGKKYLASSDKYYLSDHSFRYAKLGTKNADVGRVLENIVAVELLRRGYEIYAGVLYKTEIDFVAIKRNEKLYIQVSDYIGDQKTFDREVTPLLKIGDAYPKIVLSRTRQDEYQYEGVRIIDVSDWLLNG